MKSLLFICGLLLSTSSLASDLEYRIVLKNHYFNPAITTVPAGKKIKLLRENKDALPDEVHSDALGGEKIIAGHGKGVILIGPLKPGKHSFMGEFNATTAQGIILAK